MEDKYHKIPNEYIPALCMSAICIIYVYQQKKYKFYVGVGRAKKFMGRVRTCFFPLGRGELSWFLISGHCGSGQFWVNLGSNVINLTIFL